MSHVSVIVHILLKLSHVKYQISELVPIEE